MPMKILAGLCLLLVLSLLAGGAAAEPVLFEGNGHYYEFVDESLTWDEAKAAAEALVFMGVNGHLATMTSEAENEFVCDTLSEGRCWVGGHQLEGSPEPDGGWTWITGELWEYESWKDGEPNDWEGEEHVLELYFSGCAWNDASADSLRPYMVEYAVPEPSVVVVVGLGVLGLIARKRR